MEKTEIDNFLTFSLFFAMLKNGEIHPKVPFYFPWPIYGYLRNV